MSQPLFEVYADVRKQLKILEISAGRMLDSDLWILTSQIRVDVTKFLARLNAFFDNVPAQFAAVQSTSTSLDPTTSVEKIGFWDVIDMAHYIKFLMDTGRIENFTDDDMEGVEYWSHFEKPAEDIEIRFEKIQFIYRFSNYLCCQRLIKTFEEDIAANPHRARMAKTLPENTNIDEPSTSGAPPTRPASHLTLVDELSTDVSGSSETAQAPSETTTPVMAPQPSTIEIPSMGSAFTRYNPSFTR